VIKKLTPLIILTQVQSWRPPNSLFKNTSYDVYRSLRSIHTFLHSSSVYPSPNPMLYNVFQKHCKDSQKCLFSRGHLHHHVIHVSFLDPLDSAFQTALRSVQPFSHISWQSVKTRSLRLTQFKNNRFTAL